MAACELAGVTNEDVDQAIERGRPAASIPARCCSTSNAPAIRLTDFGLAERFRDRFGA
jgi:hypothetical protein